MLAQNVARGSVPLLLLVALSCGCDQSDGNANPPAGTPAPSAVAPDPKTEFEKATSEFIASLSNELMRSYLADGATNKLEVRFRLDQGYSIDARKTDSLITPFVGSLDMKIYNQRRPADRPADYRDEYRYDLSCTFKYQDGWQVGTIRATRTEIFRQAIGGKDVSQQIDLLSPEAHRDTDIAKSDSELASRISHALTPAFAK